MNIIRFSVLFSCTFWPLINHPASAELVDPFEQSATKTDILFQDIPSVYSASKYDQKISKAPASISIVTADEIKKWGYRTFGDILASLKGFYVTNDRNYGAIGMRGFGTPSDFNTRLLLLIDGHRYNDNINESFDITEGFPIDIDIIERVEVVRGPSSSLYGTNAFLGVINIITKQGRDQNGANVRASYGSNDTYKTSVSYGERFSNGLEAFFSGTLYDSKGFNSLYHPEFDDPATNNGLSIDLDAERSKKLFTRWSWGDFSFEASYVKRHKDVPNASFETVFNDPNFYTDNASGFLELNYDHTFENQLKLQSRLSYNHTRYHGDYPYDFSETATPDIVLNKDLHYGQWWRAELEASKIFWDNHRISAGGQYQDNFHQLQTNYDREIYLASHEATYQWGLFVQDEYSITDDLTFNAGLRFDYFSIFGKTLNPRLGLLYNLQQNSTVKLLYGTAFRAPSQYELNFSDGGLSSIPSENLKPEKLDTLEFILEHYFDAQLRAEFNVFHTHINDQIALVAVDDNLAQQQNRNNIETTGIEVQLENNWLNGWQARTSYTWQTTTNKLTNEGLANSPEHLLKLNLIAPLWMDKVFLGFETQVMSARKTPSGGSVDGRVLSNLTIYTQKWYKGLELSGSIYNLFDQRYYDPAADIHRLNAIEQDSLTFRIRASFDF